MQYRNFGNTTLRVSEIGLGCGWANDGPQIDFIGLLRRALDLGVNFYDTAAFYNNAQSEVHLGKAFADRRDQVIIASKFGKHITPDGLRPDWSAGFMLQTLEESLQRLQSDYIDIWQLHSPDPEVLDNAELFAALQKAQQEGKIRYYGISLDGAQFTRDAIARWQVQSIQSGFNLFAMRAAELFSDLQRAGVGFIARSPLDSGILGGDMLPDMPFKGEYDPRRRWGEERTRFRQALLDEIRFLLKDNNRPWAQAALQFVLSYDAVSTAICSTTSVKHLEENVTAAGAKLSAEEIQSINNLMDGKFRNLNLGWG